MDLTNEEQRILDGEKGFAKQKAMEILVALGRTYDASELISIKSAHLSGVSYKSLGDAGLELLKKFAESGGKVEVKTTLNPGGVSPKMNPPEKFVEKQNQVTEAYKELGVDPVLTCTPYYAGNKPASGDHLAWAESSAVVYANSVLGAYTNREGGPSALAAALIGKTPNYGLHLDKNRKARVEIEYSGKLDSFVDFAALGYYCGKKFEDKIISLNFPFESNMDNLKGMSAAIAASGSVAMFKMEEKAPEKVEISQKEVNSVFEQFNSEKEPDLVCIGCPHASRSELKELSKMLSGREIRSGVQFWIFAARHLTEEFPALVDKIEESGAKVITDTCMVVAPLEELGYQCMLTNSAKAAFYSRTLSNVDTKLDDLENIVEYST